MKTMVDLAASISLPQGVRYAQCRGVPKPSLTLGLISGLLVLGYGFRRVRRL